MSTYKSPKVFNKRNVITAAIAKGATPDEAQNIADDLELEARQRGYAIIK